MLVHRRCYRQRNLKFSLILVHFEIRLWIEQVSWYRADAFCKFYGMDLISIDDEFVHFIDSNPSVQSAIQSNFVFEFDGSLTISSMDWIAHRLGLPTGQKFWTSARNLLEPDFWFWTGNGVPINVSSISNLNNSTQHPHCMTWDSDSGFRQTDCFGDGSKISFICQQNFKQIAL